MVNCEGFIQINRKRETPSAFYSYYPVSVIKYLFFVFIFKCEMLLVLFVHEHHIKCWIVEKGQLFGFDII